MPERIPLKDQLAKVAEASAKTIDAAQAKARAANEVTAPSSPAVIVVERKQEGG